MASSVLLYVGSVSLIVWGMAHIVPAKSVISGFGQLSTDNRRIITMEWIAEGLTICFLGVLVLLVTALAGAQDRVATIVYLAAAVMLVVMAGLSLLTGARTSIVPMRICPLVKTTVAVLFIVAAVV